MSEATSVKELNAVLVGSNSFRKYLVGNIIPGRQAFDLGDVKPCCERGEGVVCGRRVTLVKAPRWLRGYDLCNTPELLETEVTLSITHRLHGFILLINDEISFKKVHKQATVPHLQHFLVTGSWREEPPLQSLLEVCGNRYHVLCDDGTDSTEGVKELFEKIDTIVAENSCYETDSTLSQMLSRRGMKWTRKLRSCICNHDNKGNNLEIS